MEFTLETVYDQKALTAMARTLRKTLRKKRSRRSHAFGWIIVVLSVLLSLRPGTEGVVISFRMIITWLATLLIVVVLIWEDAINGYFARKRMLPGTERAKSVFHAEGYSSTSDIGKTEWHYDKINLIAETDGYFVFVFNASHAQVYDKRGISGGTAEEFSRFIEEMTGKKLQKIK